MKAFCLHIMRENPWSSCYHSNTCKGTNTRRAAHLYINANDLFGQVQRTSWSHFFGGNEIGNSTKIDRKDIIEDVAQWLD